MNIIKFSSQFPDENACIVFILVYRHAPAHKYQKVVLGSGTATTNRA